MFQTIPGRQEHFEYIKNQTKKYLRYPTHCWAKYCGSWMEDAWIDNFYDLDLSYFGPYLPLLVPGLNIWKRGPSRYVSIVNQIFELLDPNYLYITVSSFDFGIEGEKGVTRAKVPPNLLIIQSGGRGHVPIPLLKQVENVKELSPVKYETSFIGYFAYPNRREIRDKVKKLMKEGEYFFSNREPDWDIINRQTKVILSPRGFARGCVRTYEMLQQGYVVAPIFDDYIWMPYMNSGVPWDDMAIIGKNDDMENIVKKIKSIDEKKRQKMRETIIKYRHLFTYEGVMEQIALFMHGQGYLRCDTYHHTVNSFS